MSADEIMTPEDVLSTRRVVAAVISPNDGKVAYQLSVPREATDIPGGAYDELHVLDIATGQSMPFITGKVDITRLAWHPDGEDISFVTKRGSSSEVWMISLKGGEARQITHAGSSVLEYRWHPSGKKLAYIAIDGKSAREKKLDDLGYNFIFYEEEWRHRHLYELDVESGLTEQVTTDITVWDFEYSPSGSQIVAGMSEKNLIDYRYAFHQLYLVDVAAKTFAKVVSNPGKIGNYAFSPDGRSIAYSAASSQSNHAVSHAYIQSVEGKQTLDVTPQGLRGHVQSVFWKDNNTLLFRCNEGVETTLSEVSRKGGQRKVVLSSAQTGVVFHNPSQAAKGRNSVAVGESPAVPGDVYLLNGGKMKRLTDVNPWLASRKLGRQEVLRYPARDGVEIEGLLIYPVGYEAGQSYPLVVTVHGGPESNYSNGWLTRYANPGQAQAGRGYLVFYPNYRSSTGYGVDYGKTGYGDAAGVEFDDIADGIDYLTGKGLADKQRVGLGGGSYGGYASAWFATRYTSYVRAVCMFVGISDLISKRGTTDIPYEELFVHSGKKLEEMWEQSLERSPIFYAHQSRTATLIYGGADDPRVHPSQSVELYRRMKMNDHPAVRLVQYPGEGHGNRKQAGQIDVVHRIMDWFDWYVKDLKPLDGAMPPLDISDKYGLELPK